MRCAAILQPSSVLFGFHLHEPSSKPGWKSWVAAFKEQMLFLTFYHYSIAIAGYIGNGICRAKISYLFDGISSPITPCNLSGLHITCCIKIRSHFHIDLFRFATAVSIHSSQLLCKVHNYLSYYNKSLRCFQEKAQQLLAMQKKYSYISV